MATHHLLSQLIGFQKTVFNNAFNSLRTVQENAASAVEATLQEAGGLPEPAESVVSGWLDLYRNGCDTVQAIVDRQFDTVEAFFADAKS